MSIIEYIKYLYRQSRRPSYLLPEPKSKSRKEIQATRKKWDEIRLRRKELEENKAYLSYEIPDTIHLEDYIHINTNDLSDPNPVLYKIIVPLPQEFHYKGKKWRFTDEYWKGMYPHGLTLVKGEFKNGYFPTKFELEELKNNILDIRSYNRTRIDELRRFADTVEHYLAMGIDGVEEIID